MTKKEFESFRKGILSSGLPLEFEVRRIVSEFDPRRLVQDFSFTRRTESGSEKDFSVDIAASYLVGALVHKDQEKKRVGSLDIEWDVLIECKHCRDGVAWVFLPGEEPSSPTDSHPCYTVLEDFCGVPIFREERGPVFEILAGQRYSNPSITWGELLPLMGRIPACTKGFELRDASPNPSVVVEGVHQLQYGHAAKVAEDLPRLMFDFLFRKRGDTGTIRIYSSLLVTTARLYILKPDINLDRIAKAISVADIAEEASFLELGGPYSPDFISYRRSLLDSLKNFGTGLEDVTPRRMKESREACEGLAKRIHSTIPSTYVVRLGALKDFLGLQNAALRKVSSTVIDRYLSRPQGPFSDVAQTERGQ